MSAKKSARGTGKKSTSESSSKQQADSDNFLEQTMSSFEERARKEMDDLRERLEGGFEEVSSRATRTTSKLEDAFDKRVAMAYNRLGLPSKADIDALSAKIDSLQASVAALEAQAISRKDKKHSSKRPDSAKKKTASKKSTSKKSTSKKSAAKKTTRKKTTRKPK